MSLRVWLPLNGDLHNQGISDLQFEYTGSNLSINNNGKIGACYSRTARAADAIISDKTIDLGLNQSMFCWIKMDAFNSSSNLTGILGQHRYPTNTGMGITLKYKSATTGQLSVNTGTGSARTFVTYLGNTILETGIWYHVGYTYNGSIIKLYVNGIEDGSHEFTGMSCPAEFIQIGNWSFSSSTLTNKSISNYSALGSINDVRIYDHCLSAAEVKEIAQGLVLHYKLDSIGNGPNLITTVQSSTVTLTGTEYTNAYTASWYLNSDIKNNQVLKENTVVTVVYDYTVNTLTYESAQLYSQFNGSRLTSPSQSNTDIRTNTSGRCIETFKLTAAQANSTASNYYLRFRFYANGGDSVTISNVQFYFGDKSTLNIIEDSSGYGHHGTAFGNLTTTTNSARHFASTHFNGTNTYIAAGRDAMVRDAITVNLWGYQETWAVTPGNMISCTQAGGWNFENNSSRITFACGTGESANTYKSAAWTGHPFSSLSSGWHMFTGTYDGFKTKLYVDGELVATNNAYDVRTPLFYHGSNGIFIGAEANTNQTTPTTPYFSGNLSDVRIYCTPLLDTDIKQLYNVSMKIDKQSNMHPFEINENKYNKITKTGILCNNIVEPYLTLPDGSNWKLLLYHYVDGGNNLFTQSNATYCNELGLYSRLKDIDNYTYNDKYEFYVIQDGVEYRWTQTSQPTAASISGLTTVSGYTNPVNGLAKANQSNTYLGYGSWWGACGCWTQYSTGGKTGIPGFGAHNAAGMCTEYLALYARIDDSQASFINLNSEANQFIER